MELIDEVLATGRKYGYAFEVKIGNDPEYEYEVTATPTFCVEESMHFKVDQSGSILCRRIGEKWRPIGR